MASKHSCRKYRLMLDDYIDGSLSEEERQKLEAHLSACGDCRRELHFSRELRSIISRSAEAPPEALHQSIIESCRKERKQKARKGLIRIGATAAIFAVICISSAIAYALLPGDHRSEDIPNRDTAASESPSDSSSDEEIELLPECGSMDSANEDDGCIEGIDAIPKPESESMNAPSGDPSDADTAGAVDTGLRGQTSTADPDSTAGLFTPQTTEAVGSEQDSNGSKRPGGEEITLAVLILSGLLAIASFIAFLISLSSIRNSSSKSKKDDR